jgi:hypothetical protein
MVLKRKDKLRMEDLKEHISGDDEADGITGAMESHSTTLKSLIRPR